MSVQLSDSLLLDGKEYAITGIDGAGLFEPADEGIEPASWSTAVWRGHIETYAVIDRALELARLQVGGGSTPPALDGVEPHRSEFGEWLYPDLSRPVPFTGRLLIAADLAEGRPYIGFGFWPAWFFDDVVELAFSNGRLTGRVDRSAEARAVRARVRTSGRTQVPNPDRFGPMSRSFEYNWR